jgi:hypothetical protein
MATTANHCQEREDPHTRKFMVRRLTPCPPPIGHRISARRDLMAIQYKVVELKGQRDPRSGAGDTPEVTGEDIETALNEQGRDNWELFTVLERFTEISHTEDSAYAGIGSSSQQYSSRIAVTLIFKKVMA